MPIKTPFAEDAAMQLMGQAFQQPDQRQQSVAPTGQLRLPPAIIELLVSLMNRLPSMEGDVTQFFNPMAGILSVLGKGKEGSKVLKFFTKAKRERFPNPEIEGTPAVTKALEELKKNRETLMKNFRKLQELQAKQKPKLNLVKNPLIGE